VRCALWYVDHGSVKYQLYDTPVEAARAAVLGEEEDRFSVLGVQYDNGNVMDRRRWNLYDVIWNQRMQATTHSRVVDRPTRPGHDPFLDRKIDVDAADPDWLGVLSDQ
jgi:hypothetical protein